MKLKKITAILLTLTMVAGLAACGKNEEAAQTPEETAAYAEEEDKEPEEEITDEILEEDEMSEGRGDYITDLPYITIEEKNYDVKNDDHYLVEYRTAAISAVSAIEDYSALAEALDEYSKELEPIDEVLGDYGEEAMEIINDRGDEFEDEGYPIVSITTDFTPARIDTNMVSLKRLDYSYEGGAHGNSGYTGVTFDAKTGKRLAPEDIFTDLDGFMENMKGSFKEAIPMIMDPEMLFDEWEDAVDNIDLSYDSWYFDATGFTYVFNAYEIAPYAAGPAFVSIGYEQLTPFINSDYLPTGGDQIAAVNPGNAGCVSLVDGIYVSIENEYDNDDYTKGSGSVTIGADTKVITDTGSIDDAYLMNRLDKAYLFLNYSSNYADGDDVIWRENVAVLDVTDGSMNVIYDESDAKLLPATFDMDTFDVEITDGDDTETQMRVVSTVIGE